MNDIEPSYEKKKLLIQKSEFALSWLKEAEIGFNLLVDSLDSRIKEISKVHDFDFKKLELLPVSKLCLYN